MRRRIWMIAAGLAVFGWAAVAGATDREIQNGVTVLRGAGTLQNTGPDVPPTVIGPNTTAGSGGSTVIDNSGALNALRTGNSGAGGANANPPPGAGR